MLNNLNFTSVLLMIIGVLLIAYGGWSVFRFRSYTWGAGLMSLGAGNAIFGWTNGFSDLTPTGRILTKLGILTLGFGVLVVGYILSKNL